MNKEQFAVVAAEIRSLWPKERMLDNKIAMSTWYELLQDLSYEQARAAVHRHASTSKWPPTIADIRHQSVAMQDESTDWGKAWGSVVKAIGRFGYTREAEALDSLDELTRDTVSKLGWMQICQSDQQDLMSIRANFRMLYEQGRTAAREQAMLPQGLQQRIKVITGGELLLE